MKSLSCASLGMDCSFVAKGETDKEVIDKAMAHGKAVHSEMMMKTPPAEMMAIMKDKINAAM